MPHVQPPCPENSSFLQPAHPIFAGIGQTGGLMNTYCGIIVPFPERNRGISTQVASFSIDDVDQGLSNPPAPGGTVLATQAFNPLDPGVNIPAGGTPTVFPNYKAVGYSILELPAGTVAAGQTLAAHRILFACGTRDASNSPAQTGAPNPQVGALDLTADGQQMFLKAVRYISSQQPPAVANTWTNGTADSAWNLSSANWTAPATWTSGDSAAFTATGAGPVTLGEPITVRNFWVGATGYSFASPGGHALTLAGTTPTFTANAPVTISANIQGTDGLALQGGSSLTLEGTNTYTGGTRLRCGTLIMRAPTTGNNASPYAVDSIEALDAGATLQNYAGTPIEPLTQGYRMDLDLQSMGDDNSVFILDNENTYTGFTRMGGGRLSFTSRGKWGAVAVTGETTTSTPNGSIICNGAIGNLRVDFNGTRQVTGGLSGSGGIFANNLASTCSVLTVGAGNISNTAWPTGGGGQNGKITDNTTGSGGIVALTKTGAGTIGLPTSQNDYSGPTLIANGSLEFTATGAPSPNSDHQINSPGKLKLSYAGSRNVNSLYIDGFKQPAGTYSAAELPAFIEGSGSVTIAEVHPPSVPEISITRNNTSVTVLWTGGCGVLRESTNLTTWTDLPGATSPYVTPTTAQRKYFRIRQ